MATEPIYSFATLRNRLVVRGTLVALTGLRIGAGRASEVTSNDLPVLRDAVGAPFIPGASLKGAFRARVEALVRAVQPGQALDLLEIQDQMQGGLVDQEAKNESELKSGLLTHQEEQAIQRLIQARRNREADENLSMLIWKRSTLIDLTFGAPWIAGRIFFKDALVDRSLWFDQFETRNGVALNRDTETAEDQRLYDYEVVPAGTRFDFELILENAAAWQLGMILLALKPWERGEVQIGGFRSRGLGYVRLVGPGDREHPEVRFTSVQTIDDVLSLLADGGGTEVDTTQLERWRTAFIAVLKDPELAHEEATNA